ncbi:histone-lysine N-methyltransferase, H3 lysine-9 specific SUVH1-like [Hibiscus syriacus]|uniref:histone-lysine N-methyltransferase, H3 lysine-9 specific SUVH1-like n=1 Tax=Hibiscus syriacus TaxID=106335 RepID=UPI0019248DA0|nr:histone-lysine N-methyltransferase, H3 lysine-9 specific SUVH1-like [Hibiscus syriacus]
MEDGGGEEYIDKSRILNVKPLRCLAPIFPPTPSFPSFPHPQAAPPFMCAPPAGPCHSGFAPFYPYSGFPDTHNMQTPMHYGFNGTIPAVPINSFRSEANGDAGRSSRNPGLSEHEEDGYSDGVHVIDVEDSSKAAPKRKKNQKRMRTGSSQDFNVASSDVDIDGVVDKIVESFNLMDFDTFRRTDGDKEAVGYIRLIYDVLRRKISQIEDAKESASGVTRRPDLRAGTILMNKGIRTNVKKRIGVVPGVEIGDIFFFRMEMCLIGLHAPIMAGIDYMGLKVFQGEEPVAVSIVSSGGYGDNSDDGDVLVYSGQGGNVNNRGMEITDQKLERGNLALEKSLHRGNEVRVIRGVKDIANPTGKIYVYDGLYKIQESWVDKGKSGCNVFKYKLVRLPGQPEAYTVWKSVQQWKDGSAARVGLILQDLTLGAESIPVSLVNDVDDEKGPANFTYYPGLRYSKPVNSIESSTGCGCHGGCIASNSNCPCIQRNGGYLPYTTNGVLVSQKALIHECGSSCVCPPNCKNRVCQSGLKVRLEVFKTKDRGWGLRSWDPIRSGAFICEYAGEVIDISRAEELGGVNDDDYIFDATRTCQLGESILGISNETPKIPFPLVISAKHSGNVARFMNHSCSPNVFCQPVLLENSKECDLHVAFYAYRHIPPMTELTYSYGIVPPDRTYQRRKKCLCGSAKCVGYFY